MTWKISVDQGGEKKGTSNRLKERRRRLQGKGENATELIFSEDIFVCLLMVDKMPEADKKSSF